MELQKVNLAAIGTTNLVEETKKLEANNKEFVNETIALAAATTALTSRVGTAEGKILALETYTKVPLYEGNILPTAASKVVNYETAKEFTLTAVSKDVDGNNIVINFTVPEDVSQALDVSLDAVTGEINISHATGAGTGITITDIDGDGTTATATCATHGLTSGDKIKIAGTTSYNGVHEVTVSDVNTFTFPSVEITINESGTANIIEISTLAGSLATAINGHAEVGLLIQATMGEAGTMDYVGTAQLEGWAIGLIYPTRSIFTNGSAVYMTKAAFDGITNDLSNLATLSA